jgi:SAM-dependent methyltransferase
MWRRHVELLACPRCHGDLVLETVAPATGEQIESGSLTCPRCSESHPIVDHIPRFVPSEGYTQNFGYQWSRYAETQLDSHNGLALSEKRFYRTTDWPRDLAGELVLEAGCGAGRFTEIALATGATVVAFDLSRAVESNHRMNGASPRLLLVQADIACPPLRPGCFDRVFCMGVLQHTPSPEDAFRSLLRFLDPGGSIAIDVYIKKGPWAWLTSYRRLRWLTRHMNVGTVHSLSRVYVELAYPLARRLWRHGRIGRRVANAILLLRNRRRKGLDVSPEVEKEWLVLHLVDQLCAYHDKPQSIDEVQRWFAEASLGSSEVFHGGNGVIGRA